MSRYVDLSNPKIFHNGRDKYGNGIYHIPPDLPTDDVVERKKGKWIEKKDPYDFFYSIPVCSECGCTNTMRKRYNFCPNCGAELE